MLRRTSWVPTIGSVLFLLATPKLANAQVEAQLRRALEGKRVTLEIDMPATSEGVDLYPGTSRPLDFGKLANRLKSSGTAYKQSETAVITKVRVKDDLIEIHLGGGGYGTAGDAIGGLFSSTGADSGTAQQAKIANDRTQRLAAGSRFNLRFQNGVVPEDATPDAVLRALQGYASIVPSRALPAIANSPVEAATPSDSMPRKGMTVEELERHWGKPSSTRQNGQLTTIGYSLKGGDVEIDLFNDVAVDVRKHALVGSASVKKGMTLSEVESVAGKPLNSASNGPVTTNKYKWQDGTLEGDFVNGILVAYRITSN